jgi:hypothetical protein
MVSRYTKKTSSQTRKKGKSSPLQVSRLFGKILPDGFQAKTALINQYQHFFNSLDSDAVFQMVRVVSVEANILTVSLPSAGLVNYLRLHTQQISREIEHQFGQLMALKIISSPTGAQNEMPRPRLKPAPHFSAEVSDKIKISAKGIEDDELKQSLLRLAEAIKQKES